MSVYFKRVKQYWYYMNSGKKENNSQNNDSVDWRLKINDLVQTCQTELKKTTQIGKKMLSASQSNVKLHETYEQIGKWLVCQVKEKDLKIDDENIVNLIAKVQELKNQLEGLEKDVQDIKEK